MEYGFNKITMDVVISCQKNDGSIILQTGIGVGHGVITACSTFFLDQIDINNIYVLYKHKNNYRQCKPSGIRILHSQKLQNIIQNNFETSHYQMLSKFVFLDLNGICIDSFIVPAIDISNGKFILGEQIFISYSPFGKKEFFNFLSSGIVSSTFNEKESSLMLTDAPLTVHCVGAPIYRRNDDKLLLTGMVLSQVTQKSVLSLTLGVSFSLIYKTLAYSDLHNLCLIDHVYKPSDIESKSLEFLAEVHCDSNYGSGIIICEDGLVVTNAHVVKFNSDAAVKVCVNNKALRGTVVFSTHEDDNLDLAVIKIKTSEKFPSCELSHRLPKVGETVYSVGHCEIDKNFVKIITHGVVSMLHLPDLLCTTCMSVRGCSGGVVMSNDGDVIGIVHRSYCDHDFRSNVAISLCTIASFLHDYSKNRDVSTLSKMLDFYNVEHLKTKL